MYKMKCWTVYVLFVFGISTRWNTGVFAKDQSRSLGVRWDDSEQTRHILERRGGSKQNKKGSPKTGDQSKSNASGSGSQSQPGSSESGKRAKSEVGRPANQINLLPARPPIAPFTSRQDTASSLQLSQGMQVEAQSRSQPSVLSPAAPLTPPLKGETFSSQSSRRRQAEGQPRSVPIAPPPRAPFTSATQEAGPSASRPSRPLRQRNSKTQRQRAEMKTDSVRTTQAEMAKLRITQDSGATRAHATEPIVRPPTSGIPREAQQPAQRHIAPEASEVRRTLGAGPIPDEPSGVHPVVTHNVPAASGIGWLDEQSRIVNDWKTKARSQRGTAPPHDEGIRQILADGVKQVEKDRGMAQVVRKIDDANFEAARIAMRHGRTFDSPVRLTVQASKDATRKAQAYTFAVSHSEGNIARALARYNQWDEATKHLQKEHRAFARQELRMQRGQAFDYHYINKGVKEGLADIADRKETPVSSTIQKAVALRKTYREAAVGYRQAFKDYQTIRRTFSGSSSDESETSLFNDVLPPEDPTADTTRPARSHSGSANSGSPRAQDLPP